MIDVDPQLLASTIEGIYGAAYDSGKWYAVVRQLCSLFNGSKACFAPIGASASPYDPIATNADTEYNKRYLIEHVDNLLARVVAGLPLGHVYNDHALFGEDRLRGSRFWNEWMKPQDMYDGIAVKLVRAGSLVWFFDVQRGRNQPRFQSNDLELLRLLTTHLKRASELGSFFDRQTSLQRSFAHLPFGVVLVDQDLRVLECNNAAEQLLDRADGLLIRQNGVLSARSQQHAAQLSKAVAGLCLSGALTLPVNGTDLLLRSPLEDGPVLALSIGPGTEAGRAVHPFGQRVAVIFIKDLSQRTSDALTQQIRSLFTLTPREAQLAAALATGQSMKTIAADGAVAYSTLRSTLEHVFRKTGTHQQSELVALLKGLPPTIGS
jgi:DNA-binding CsgD family transcriptional regulator/PAS domain-containing protein